MGRSPYDIIIPVEEGTMAGSEHSGDEERGDATVQAELQFRIGKVWVQLTAHPSVPAAQGTRRALIDMASKSNGPDAAQYVRSHTRVAEVTVISWTAVVPNG